MAVPVVFYAVDPSRPSAPVTPFTVRMFEHRDHWKRQGVGSAEYKEWRTWSQFVPPSPLGTVEGTADQWLNGTLHSEYLLGNYGPMLHCIAIPPPPAIGLPGFGLFGASSTTGQAVQLVGFGLVGVRSGLGSAAPWSGFGLFDAASNFSTPYAYTWTGRALSLLASGQGTVGTLTGRAMSVMASAANFQTPVMTGRSPWSADSVQPGIQAFTGRGMSVMTSGTLSPPSDFTFTGRGLQFYTPMGGP